MIVEVELEGRSTVEPVRRGRFLGRETSVVRVLLKAGERGVVESH